MAEGGLTQKEIDELDEIYVTKYRVHSQTLFDEVPLGEMTQCEHGLKTAQMAFDDTIDQKKRVDVRTALDMMELGSNSYVRRFLELYPKEPSHKYFTNEGGLARLLNIFIHCFPYQAMKHAQSVYSPLPLSWVECFRRSSDVSSSDQAFQRVIRPLYWNDEVSPFNKKDLAEMMKFHDDSLETVD